LGINLKVIETRGFEHRIPTFLKTEQGDHPWEILKQDNLKCHSRDKNFCKLGEGDTFIHLVGDSHLAALSVEIFNQNKNKYIINIMTKCWPIDEVIYETNFAKETKCTPNFNKLRKKIITNTNESIIIIGGRLPLMLTGKYFNNKEGFSEKHININKKNGWGKITSINKRSVSDAIKKTIYDFLDDGHKVILIYPIPETGFHVPKELFKLFPSDLSKIANNIKPEALSTSYEVYKERTKSSFELLDSIQHKNLYRVYPDTVFCDSIIKDRCATHDGDNVFYADDNHPSLQGARLINDLITEKIEEINNP
jgi:hypothetical protein